MVEARLVVVSYPLHHSARTVTGLGLLSVARAMVKAGYEEPWGIIPSNLWFLTLEVLTRTLHQLLPRVASTLRQTLELSFTMGIIKRTLRVWIFVVASLCLAASCGRQRYRLPPNDTLQSAPVSKSLKVDVYLDGTSSMRGFIVPGTASRYQQLLPQLESIVARGWSGGQVVFYRFGTIIEDLPERKYLDAQHPDFYMNKKVSQETLIQNVIDKASTDDLTVIVTDLFQTDVDVNLITSRIKDKYVAKNLAVGILAVKSEFSGHIFDVGPNNYAFDYKSDNSNPITFRPFYVLVLGEHSDVSNYFDQAFKTKLGSFSETQSVIFSSYVSEKIVSFEGSAITDISKLQDIPDILPSDANTEHIKQFRIIDSSAPRASFSARLDYKPSRFTMPVDSQELEPEIIAFTPASVNEGQEEPPLQVNSEAQRAFTIVDAHLNESTLDFKAEIVPAFLPGAGVYCFKTILRPKKYQTPAWFTEWNMSSEQVEVWTKNPKEFNGTTTYNLESFLSDLWAATLQMRRPKVAEFYCYVRKD